MPAPNEYRFQAIECLKLADEAKEFYVKDALIELARKLNRDARQAERRARDFSAIALSH
jgi:hypothetical protein